MYFKKKYVLAIGLLCSTFLFSAEKNNRPIIYFYESEWYNNCSQIVFCESENVNCVAYELNQPIPDYIKLFIKIWDKGQEVLTGMKKTAAKIKVQNPVQTQRRTARDFWSSALDLFQERLENGINDLSTYLSRVPCSTTQKYVQDLNLAINHSINDYKAALANGISNKVGDNDAILQILNQAKQELEEIEQKYK